MSGANPIPHPLPNAGGDSQNQIWVAEEGKREELNFLGALIYFIVSERSHIFIIVLQFNF